MNRPIEHIHDKRGLFIPIWLQKRTDIQWGDKAIISLVIALQDNEYHRCYASQRVMGSMVGMSRKAVNLAIARLCKDDGSRKGKKEPYYKYQLLDKRCLRLRGKDMTTYQAVIEKGSPLWMIREHSEGRAGYDDVRTRIIPQFIPKKNTVAFPKRAKK
jgi:biotin operon repressor